MRNEPILKLNKLVIITVLQTIPDNSNYGESEQINSRLKIKLEYLLDQRGQLRNNDSDRFPNLTMEQCDLDLYLLTPTDRFVHLPSGPLVPICSKIAAFIFKTLWSVTNLTYSGLL